MRIPRPLQIETFVGEFICPAYRLIVNGQKRRGPVQSADKISTILLARPAEGRLGGVGEGNARARARARARAFDQVVVTSIRPRYTPFTT